MQIWGKRVGEGSSAKGCCAMMDATGVCVRRWWCLRVPGPLLILVLLSRLSEKEGTHVGPSNIASGALGCSRGSLRAEHTERWASAQRQRRSQQANLALSRTASSAREPLMGLSERHLEGEDAGVGESNDGPPACTSGSYAAQ
jgi:hypothetical protein